MSEQLTNPVSFQNFLLENSEAIAERQRQENRVRLNGMVPREELVDETELRNALHFMEDIHLFHELWLDEILDDLDTWAENADSTPRAILEGRKSLARAIGWAMQEIGLGNKLVIKTLSDFEVLSNEEFGVTQYSKATAGCWDGDHKWDSFREFADPDVPDGPGDIT